MYWSCTVRVVLGLDDGGGGGEGGGGWEVNLNLKTVCIRK